jgi:tetratricopeptide (TPR) repeat protein
MCDRCLRIGFAVSAVVLFLVSVSPAYVIVQNYDNHPALSKAKQYDLTFDNKELRKADGSFNEELYKSYVAQASRQLAEKYYLAYLEDVKDSFQRAAVYARLGDLYNGITSPHVATSVDRDKARLYYRKALEAEPERIGWATLHARGFFATDGASVEEQFTSYMDYYGWLQSIDADTLAKKMLPVCPPREVPAKKEDSEMRRKFTEAFRARPVPPSSTQGFLGVIKAQADTTARDLVHQATGRLAVDPGTGLWSRALAVKYLLVLTQRFPDSSVAERAKPALEEVTTDVADDMLLLFEDEMDERWALGFIPAVPYAVARGEAFFFDLREGKLAETGGLLHSEKVYADLSARGGDYLAWDGALITLPHDQLLAAHGASQGQMGENKRRWSVSYGLPEKVVFPYDVWLIARGNRRYLIRLAGVRSEGLHIYYRKVTDEEFQSARPAEQMAAPRKAKESSVPTAQKAE